MESLTRPAHRRKVSNASGVLSFSSKGPYDDVFAAPVASGKAAVQRFKSPAGLEEYSEIFGGGSRVSSIPVLDLSVLDEKAEEFRTSKVDYSKIFGGFGDVDIAVPFEELLSGASKSSNVSNNKERNHSDKESPLQGSVDCDLSGNNIDLSSEASDQSLDSMKPLNFSFNKTSQMIKAEKSGEIHVAKLHAVPGFTYFIDEAPRQQKTKGDRPISSIKSEVHRTWSFSGDIQEENSGRKVEMHIQNKVNSEGVVRAKRGSLRDGSQSNDKAFNASDIINLKSYSLKPSPSTPPVKLNNSDGHPKRSKSSNLASNINTFKKSAGDYSSSSSDEELDVNSVAAASAAALKRAIEQAQESIRLAKELRERKKNGPQGSSKPSSKGSFKLNDKKESIKGREANGTKENHAEETPERYGNESQGFTEINRRVTSRSKQVATTLEHSKGLSTSRVVEVEKHQENVAEDHGEAAQLLDLVNNEKHRTETLASVHVENKNSVSRLITKQACSIDKMTTAKETLEHVENSLERTKTIEGVFGMGNAEIKVNVDQHAQALEENVNYSVYARIMHEYGASENSKITREDIQRSFKERGEYEKKEQECLDVSQEQKSEPPKSEDDFMLKESQTLEKEEKKLPEDFPQAPMKMESEKKHLQEEIRGGLRNECSEDLMVHEEACQFKENDDKPAEVCGSGSYEMTHKDTIVGEVRKIPDIIQEKNVDEMELVHARNKEEKIAEEELDRKVNEEQVFNDEEPTCSSVEGEEVQKQPEETYNYVEVDHKVPGEEFEWGEVEKRIKEACVTEVTEMVLAGPDRCTENLNVEAEEAGSLHSKARNWNNNQEIAILHESSYERHSIPTFDAFSDDGSTMLHEGQEAHVEAVESSSDKKTSQDAIENHENSSSTTGISEAFREWDANKDKAVKEASEPESKIFETGDSEERPYQEHVGPSEKPSASTAVKYDACHNDVDPAHKLSRQNVLEKSYFVPNAPEENDNNIEMQDVSDAFTSDSNAAEIDSSEKSSQGEMEENVMDPEGDLGHKSQEYGENIEEAVFVLDKQEEKVGLKVVHKGRKIREDLNEAESNTVAGEATVCRESAENDKEMKMRQNIENVEEYPHKAVPLVTKEARETSRKELKEKDHSRKIEDIKREREREKDRMAVERAIREARERAFAEARERAERAAVERAAAEVRQRVMAEAREKFDKATTGSKLADKASNEAKLRAERAAVERATAEARERALEKALSQKSTAQARVQTEQSPGVPRERELKHSMSSSDLERIDSNNSESAQRRKARLERHQRIMERAAKALAEKNMRDLQAQKEQAERNRLAESLDADIKRWASGKEGNLRALLSTLQYILGTDGGWQPISLTEIVTTAAVRKAYRKATLYVHPDKLQQRGASIQQKYICEKVFDLLKAAWNKFNSEER